MSLIKIIIIIRNKYFCIILSYWFISKCVFGKCICKYKVNNWGIGGEVLFDEE